MIDLEASFPSRIIIHGPGDCETECVMQISKYSRLFTEVVFPSTRSIETTQTIERAIRSLLEHP